jgi:hypothetical protein
VHGAVGLVQVANREIGQGRRSFFNP